MDRGIDNIKSKDELVCIERIHELIKDINCVIDYCIEIELDKKIAKRISVRNSIMMMRSYCQKSTDYSGYVLWGEVLLWNYRAQSALHGLLRLDAPGTPPLVQERVVNFAEAVISDGRVIVETVETWRRGIRVAGSAPSLPVEIKKTEQ